MADEKVGGPGIDPVVTPPKFEFKHGDKTFTSQDDLTKHLESLGTEIKALKDKQVATPVERVVERKVETKPSDETAENAAMVAEMLGNPKAFIKKLGDNLRNDIQQDMIVQQQAREGLNQFWGNVWTDLEKVGLKKDIHQGFVNGIFNDKRAEFAALKMPDAHAALVKSVKETVASLAPSKDRTKPSGDRTQVEGGAAAGGRKSSEEGENTITKTPGTLSEAIRARRAARVAAASGSQQKH